MNDPFHLQRFVDAQQPVIDTVRAELRAGRKQSHWMWFVFPQLAGLGHSVTARRFAISSLAEARAYLAHPVLGARLRECSRLAAAIDGRSADEVFGYPDDMKFRSSMTLFAQAASEPAGADPAADASVFIECLRKYFDGQPDQATLDLLGRPAA